MKKLLLSTAMALAALAYAMPASAGVTIIDQLSGTGDNVIFDSKSSTQVVGSFNGQHQGIVDFNCLTVCAGFTGAQNGNDLKIENFGSMFVQVFDTTGTTVLPTATDVFSITGTGDVTVTVTANEPGGGTTTFAFDLLALFGPLGPGQNGFTLTAINGESINSFTIADSGGVITDFEHYRIDVAASAVPEPATWGMMLLGFVGLAFAFRSRRKILPALA